MPENADFFTKMTLLTQVYDKATGDEMLGIYKSAISEGNVEMQHFIENTIGLIPDHGIRNQVLDIGN